MLSRMLHSSARLAKTPSPAKKAGPAKDLGKMLAMPPKEYKKQHVAKPLQTVRPELQIPQKSYKHSKYTRVNFNLKRIRQLPGSAKIELMQDYIKTKSVAEALFVYDIIIYGGISNRLSYNDHHNIFHLALSDCIKYKKDILAVHDQLQLNKFVPTENYLNEYVICCTKWNNVDAALAAFAEVKKAGVPCSAAVWDHMFRMFCSQKTKESWELGLEIYAEMKATVPVVRPNRNIYLRVAELYEKLGDVEKALDIYVEAEENLERLTAAQSIRDLNSDPIVWKTNTHIMFFNAYLDTLVACDKPDDAHTAYIEFYGELNKGHKGPPSLLQTYHILFKMLSKLPTETVDHRAFVIQRAKGYWADLSSMKVQPDFKLHGRMIELQSLAASSKSIHEWYRLAVTSLTAGPTSSKRLGVDSAYIRALTLRGDTSEALEALETQRASGRRKPFIFVYADLIDAFISQKDLGAALTLVDMIQKDFESLPESDIAMYKSRAWVQDRYKKVHG